MRPQSRVIISPEDIKRTAEKCNVSQLTASLLLKRGITEKDEADLFLYGTAKNLSDPYKYINMDLIINRLRYAVQNKEKIVIYGDYDCDGIGATAIYYLAFKKANVPVFYYIPTRKDEGYGLNNEAITKIKNAFAPDILLTADCGITSQKEVAFAKEIGMEVIVTDHHTPPTVPLNCLYTDPCYTPELTQLCAAGVALYVIRALFGEEESRNYYDICAVSTVADIVSLKKDNRILVKEGLKKIHASDMRPGLKMLIQNAKCNIRTLSYGDISFKIAPRLNAAGRLSTPINALKLLIDDDPVTISLLAENLSLQNAERQQLSNDIYKDTLTKLKGYDFGKYRMIMLAGDWNEGVVGIVCSKLVEFFHMPAILLCNQENGTLCGSARSIEGVNIYDLLFSAKDYLLTFGGHAKAAGLSLLADNFNNALNKMNDRLIDLPDEIFLRKVYYDEILPIKSISWEVYEEISLFEPFGEGNPTPVFYDNSPDYTFRKGSDRYPMIKANAGIGEIISFDGLSKLPCLNSGNYSILYTLDKNTFNGYEKPQFNVKDFFIDNYVQTDNEVFYEDFLTEIEYPNGKKSTDKPSLYICFTNETFTKLLTELPSDVAVYYKDTIRPERRDGVVLCPKSDFPFFYFSKILFCDYVHPTILSMVNKIGCEVKIVKNLPMSLDISVDLLRKVYVYYLKTNIVTNKNTTVSECYKEGAPGDKESFVAATYILMECGLIKKDDLGNLVVKNVKTDPTGSGLYRYLRGNV